MKIILWDFTGQAENFISQEMKWNRLEVVYKFDGDAQLKYLPNILHNVPHECLLIFENGQWRKSIEEFMSQAAIQSEKTIFALDVNSWIDHFDFAKYLFKSDSRFLRQTTFMENRSKSPTYTCNLNNVGGGGGYII